MHNIEDQIAFVDMLSSHTDQAEDLQLLAAIKSSLQSLMDGKTKAPKQKIKLLHYQQFVGIYDQFCRKVLGAPGIIDARQGGALKRTVAYIMKQERVNGDEEQALDGWKYIFGNWRLLSDFLQRQPKLTDIERNIQQILYELKNASKEAKKRKSDSDWDRYRQQRQGQ